MKYLLPLMAAFSIGCSDYSPIERSVLDEIPGQELVTEDWYVSSDCGEEANRITCFRAFNGPQGEFFSFSVDKWNNPTDFDQEVDAVVEMYRKENEKCPDHLAQEFVENHANNSLITIMSEQQDKYSADKLAKDYLTF